MPAIGCPQQPPLKRSPMLRSVGPDYPIFDFVVASFGQDGGHCAIPAVSIVRMNPLAHGMKGDRLVRGKSEQRLAGVRRSQSLRLEIEFPRTEVTRQQGGAQTLFAFI